MLILCQVNTCPKGISMKWKELKSAIQQRLKGQAAPETEKFEKMESCDHYLDDLPLTLNRDPSPSVRSYSMESSEYSQRFDGGGVSHVPG
jgi:hypothetical protein